MIENYTILKEFPLVRILTLVLGAFILGLNIPYAQPSLFLLAISVLSLLLAIYTRHKYRAVNILKLSRLSSLLLHTSMFLLCFVRAQLASPLSDAKHYSKLDHNIKHFSVLKIEKNPILKSKSYQVIASYKSVVEQNSTKAYKGKIILYLEADKQVANLKIGDLILANLDLQEIAKVANPEEFDYKKFLERKAIFAWAYCKKEDWLPYKKSNTWNLPRFIEEQRIQIKSILKNHLKDEKVEAVALALIIGEKNELSKEIRNSYAHSGTMHVLAVSGLHLGVLYLAINYLLSFLKAKKYLALKLLLLLVSLWFYAFLTGSSPSVLRAACMFSLLAIAKSFQRKTQVLNILASSAIILLLVKPDLIYEIGFQLSYLALLGIISFHSKIYSLVYFENSFLDKLWSLIVVSLAAQITSSPISLYYFHVFPNFFILSNIVVVPLAILSVYSGFFLILFSKIKVLAAMIAQFLSYAIKLMNYAVEGIDACPYSLSEGIYLTSLECIMMYAIILLVYLSIELRQKESLFGLLILLLSFVALSEFSYWQKQGDAKLCVYKLEGHSAIEFQLGTKAYQILDKELQLDEEIQQYKLGNFWIKEGIQEKIDLHHEKGLQYLQIRNTKILIFDSLKTGIDTILPIDYCIIKQTQSLHLKDISCIFPSKIYLFDSSLPSKQIKYWKKECESLNLNCYFVSENQAFVEKLN